MQNTISKATEYNWRRLNTRTNNRLTSRANKTASKRRIVASGYIKENREAEAFLHSLMLLDAPVKEIMYSLCRKVLVEAGIIDLPHVRDFLENYSGVRRVRIDVPDGMFCGNDDILGYVYQSLVDEGQRNTMGLYYTQPEIVDYLLGGHVFGKDETILDPCCGSGAFLLRVNTAHPENIYGYDVDEIAVMIASTNLLVKYAGYAFKPRIYCKDLLKKDWLGLEEPDPEKIPDLFDYVYTNPPWGADRMGFYTRYFPEIKSRERASMVIAESIERLKPGGHGCFLLPSSLLTTGAHSDIRKLILNRTAIKRIHRFDNRFDGVYTDFFALEIDNRHTDAPQTYTVIENDSSESRVRLTVAEQREGNIPCLALPGIEDVILQKIESRRHDDLSHSLWALGIVTGDNKSKLSDICMPLSEAIFTGKQIEPFRLMKPTRFIRFNPAELQQCAPEHMYRAPEKLIYKFIAKYPVVAYDDTGSLCLNSANIVIPRLDGISVKSAAALLNSSIYRLYYSAKFHDIKVLKGNLSKIPFPALTPAQDNALSQLASDIITNGMSETRQRSLDTLVSAIFEISEVEQEYVYSKFNITA